ncbi:transcriptional regulator, MerR family [Lachnospiraceae bacterium KM106-2]|nr:transcriptional regulator, MerR family [Lachnospiraceae bacterium KM106-2]
MYTMKQACEEVGMTYEALKFYCNQNLVPNVKRDKNNHRIFNEHDIAWIKGLTCLKSCGMSIKEMKEYLALCLEGESSIPKRQIILDAKRIALQKSMEEIQKSIDYIDWKQNFYQEVLSGETKYFSNLLYEESED